jgi:two-component system, OmpR family, response regulator
MEHSKTILLVDDDVLLTRLMSVVLNNAGYNTLVGYNGQEALDLVFRDHAAVDLIVLDVSMPRMNGVEAAGCLRADARLGDVPIILCTGHVQAEPVFVAGLPNTDGIEYLVKPFRMSHFLQRVQAILQPGR